MERELHLHKLSLSSPGLSLGPGAEQAPREGQEGDEPVEAVPQRPSLGEMGQTPSTAPDREAVADQETEFIG